jgi:hypothetical protein
MPVSLACPQCHKQLQVKDEWAGKRVRCPGCQAVLSIPLPAPARPPSSEALAPILVADPPAEPVDSYPPETGGRRLWPWLVAGGGGLLLVAVIVTVLLLVLGGGDADTRVVRARRALLDAARGERLTPNNPGRDVVVVLRIKLPTAKGSQLGQMSKSYLMAAGQRRSFNFMRSGGPSEPVWLAAVVPIEAKTVTLHWGDEPPKTIDLPETIVDEAKAFD